MICFHSLAHEGAGRDVMNAQEARNSRPRNRTKKAIGAVSFPMILELLIGCAEGPPLQTAVLAKPDRRLEIYGVRTYQHKNGVLVTGASAGHRFSLEQYGVTFTSKAYSMIDGRRSLSIRDGEPCRAVEVGLHGSTPFCRQQTRLRSKV